MYRVIIFLTFVFFSKRSHIRQAIMDVIFGKKLDIPMYQTLKVKSEPITKTNNQPVITVSELGIIL